MEQLITAEIITIGDEILYGQITDTNSQWISSQLDNIGVKVKRKTAIGDERSEILGAFKSAASNVDIIIVTGGLGPTNDDITKSCFCQFFDCEEEINLKALQDVQAFFEKRGRELSPMNRLQASLPTACTPIYNQYGTAPGMWFEKEGKNFISMPGVPFEMKAMFTNDVIPLIRDKYKLFSIYHQWIKTVGIGESIIAERIKPIEDALPNQVRLAYLPSLGEVKLRLTCFESDKSIAQKQCDYWAKKILAELKEEVYSLEDINLVEYIAKQLIDKKMSLATAESCTGGYIAHQLTSVSGSSNYFKGSIVAYHNDVKQTQLKVSESILEEHGAVSEPVVKLMAEHVRKLLKTSIGVACSGIAGPNGGTQEKPVGTVWIAYSDEYKTVAKKINLGNLRENNIKLTCINVLNFIRKNLR
ncbi:MAG: competence/damage-inducible protein A [Cytophagales bacterium]|nr:MAG: competence/damage-inducible protein A [Cytophagales bacterium]